MVSGQWLYVCRSDPCEAIYMFVVPTGAEACAPHPRKIFSSALFHLRPSARGRLDPAIAARVQPLTQGLTRLGI